MVTDHLKDLVLAAFESATADATLDAAAPEIQFDRPRRKEHGDWSTNVALTLRGPSLNPRQVAQMLVDRLPASPLLERAEVAGPGFINFHLAHTWLHEVVARAADTSSGFGRARSAQPRRINVEYVSSNPTGPVNVVSGRHAAFGDAIANLLEAVGHDVVREFYINDAGRQADLFAESLAVRYLEEFGIPGEIPDQGYQGEYMVDLARHVAGEIGDRLVGVPPEERVAALKETGLRVMLELMRRSLERFGTRFDEWFSESTLHARGLVDRALDELRSRGEIEERDGALWFRATQHGDDKDRVVVRATGEPTYLAGDSAYLLDKFARGFDEVMYVWGSDHHGTVARLLAVAEALGFERSRVEVLLIQTVTLLREGEAVKASKRAGVIVPLDELVDEVGTDAARYTFLTRSIDAPLEFDIALAKRQAPENPVYYVQYAHARICSILRNASPELVAAATDAALDSLGHSAEDTLMRKLAAFEEVVPHAAEMRAPQRICRYAEELASDFTAFYRDCRVITDDVGLTRARLRLCIATKNVVANALALLGVSAPESM